MANTQKPYIYVIIGSSSEIFQTFIDTNCGQNMATYCDVVRHSVAGILFFLRLDAFLNEFRKVRTNWKHYNTSVAKAIHL